MQSTEEKDYHHEETEQETVGNHSATINRLKMLNLNNTSTQPPLPSSFSSYFATRCTACCGSSSFKRRSPSSSFIQEPSAKKQLLALLPLPHSPTGNFTPPIKTQMAPLSPAPILRRCISDPVTSPGTKPQSPEKATSGTAPSPLKAPLPPMPRHLRRSISDPLSHSPSSGEPNSGSRNRGGGRPSSKSLMRLKDRTEEMLQLWDQLTGEEGEDGEAGIVTEVECAETETEEAVTVEKRGECSVIHFKCPCKKEYQILLSGKNCFYKL